MNTIVKQQKTRLTRHSLFLFLVGFFAWPVFAYQDQIVMTSDKQIKTLFDVKAYAILRNLYQNDTLINPENIVWQKAYLLAERDGYLEQLLVQKYVEDNRVKLKDQDLKWEEKSEDLYKRWLREVEQNPNVSQWGISKNQIIDWVKNRHILETFLSTHRPFQAIVTSRKIEQHYQEKKSSQFLDQPFEDIRAVVEEDFKQNFLKQEFQRWVNQELRRQKWKLYNIEPKT